MALGQSLSSDFAFEKADNSEDNTAVSSPGFRSRLKTRWSTQNMSATVRTVKIKDLVEGVGYIYKDSSEWGINFPDANGENQSPIDINSRDAVYDENLGGTPLNFSYVLCRETDVCNNGHTLVVYLKYRPGDGFRNDPSSSPKSTLSGGPLPPGSEYELAEFRFHWGKENTRGSEHTVNFKAFPMELHLIHYNIKKYGSLEEALGKPDGVIIVGLFIMVGREHAGLKQLTEHLCEVTYKGRQKTITTPFNPMCLLPDPMLRDYWAYSGSLTSPPCCENVTWVLLRYPLTVSDSQIDEFRGLKTYPEPDDDLPDTSSEGALVDNFRPTQPLNDRVIKASFPQ